MKQEIDELLRKIAGQDNILPLLDALQCVCQLAKDRLDNSTEDDPDSRQSLELVQKTFDVETV